MHGLGNDYVYVNCFRERVEDPATLARAVSHRRFGIGSDGLILITPSDVAPLRMRMFNVDGTEGQMCGNGLRCVAKLAWDSGICRENPMRIETGRGVLEVRLLIGTKGVESVTVDMGEPILEPAKIPFLTAQARALDAWTYEIELLGRRVQCLPVSTGNPHAVFFCEELDRVDLALEGPAAENHAAFPERVNAHWAQVLADDRVRMKTWERGSGVTWACGTGACAVTAAAHLTGRTGANICVELPGGELKIRYDPDSRHLFMTGPATTVFEGEFRWP